MGFSCYFFFSIKKDLNLTITARDIYAAIMDQIPAVPNSKQLDVSF